ncbi:8790_t:CDS:1, partial [Paraglomus occultum]
SRIQHIITRRREQEKKDNNDNICTIATRNTSDTSTAEIPFALLKAHFGTIHRFTHNAPINLVFKYLEII